jgi:rubrerythrin
MAGNINYEPTISFSNPFGKIFYEAIRGLKLTLHRSLPGLIVQKVPVLRSLIHVLRDGAKGGAVVNENERLNALEVALNNEVKEREFYLKNAERTKNPLGKTMFKQIGDEELEHYERLKQLHAEWEKRGAWPETLPLVVNGTVVKDILTTFIQKVDKSTSIGDADDLRAVRTAIDFEAEGAAFYARLRDSVTDKKEKAFFDLMATIEREHYLSLKSVEEYFVDPASWYRGKEHHSLDAGG